MGRPTMRWTLSLSALGILAAGAVASCSRPPGALAPSADAGGLDAAVDAGADGGPLRRLTARRLFGTLPVANGVADPMFSTLDDVSWSTFSYMGGRSLATPLHVPTPTGLPALRVIRAGSQAQVSGLVRSAAGPVEASIWCGWPVDEADPDPGLSLLGLYADGQGAADFEPDPATPPVILGELRWTRYVARVEPGPMGWATLRITHRATYPVYLNGPAVVAAPAGARKAAGGPRPARIRPLSAEERRELRRLFDRFRDRFGGPARARLLEP